MDDRSDKYTYGGRPCSVSDAAGVTGVLIRSGGSVLLRVYEAGDQFTDYDILHDDLAVTIGNDAMASFYSDGDRSAIDHSPAVLGLRKIAS